MSIRLLLMLSLLPVSAFGDSDAQITDLIQKEQSLPILDARIDFVSTQFLDKPYVVGPLGEGADAKYDQDPLYRTDGFDCTTFVETMFAIARAKTFSDFQFQQNHIRYRDGAVDFTRRNHFVEIDWNPNNIAAGIFSDVTTIVGNADQVGFADRTISKKDWYAHLPLSEIHLLNPVGVDMGSLLDSLHHEGEQFADVASHFPYLKKEFLLTVQNKLPTPAVLNIVRDVVVNGITLTEVTHQVILFSKNRNLRIREASSKAENMRVVDESFSEYVKELMDSPSTRGVNILKAFNP